MQMPLLWLWHRLHQQLSNCSNNEMLAKSPSFSEYAVGLLQAVLR
jgi:hypothetical protein